MSAAVSAGGLRRLADRIEAAGVPLLVYVNVHPDDPAVAGVLVDALALPGPRPVAHTAASGTGDGRSLLYWDQSLTDDCLSGVTVVGEYVDAPAVAS